MGKLWPAVRTNDYSRRTVVFVNLAHALDHFVLLIFPTAVIAIAAEWGLPSGTLISLSTGAFVAFGLFSLPAGWLADRLGRRNLLAAFFLGSGVTCIGLATSTTPLHLGAWLLALGVFSSIYHPVGSAMLVSNARRLGRDLGINAVWGNLGAAFAPGVTAAIAAALGWRASFVLPGLLCAMAGFAFLCSVPADKDRQGSAAKAGPTRISVGHPVRLALVFALALVAGGMTFNMATIGMPMVIDNGLGTKLPLVLVGSLATAVLVFGALTQTLVGRLVDKVSIPKVFMGLAVLQPIGFGLAAFSSGPPVLAGLALVTAAIYGQVIVNDATVARYVPAEFRAKAFGFRYFLSFATGGLAVPLIALLYGGGAQQLLIVGGLFGGVVLACAVGFYLGSNAAPARPTS